MSKTNFRITGIHVVMGLALVIGVPIAASIWYLARAIDSWPGQVDRSAYHQRASYVDKAAAIARQDALQWRWIFAIDTSPTQCGSVTASVDLRDRAGRQVRVTDATGLFRHPLQEFRDTLARPDTGRSPGQYRFQADLPNPGKWTFVFRATATGGVRVRRDFDVQVCDR